jgi:hypothetical protein
VSSDSGSGSVGGGSRRAVVSSGTPGSGSEEVTFGCQDCGDCSLPEIAYLCPESQCAKNQRNGPCGGTRPGSLCEVGDKACI